MLAAAFLLSGFSGLVYEVLWLRMLIRVFGISVFAVSTVVTVFMAGLAAGGFFGGRLFQRTNRPLRTYVGIEVAVAVLALLSTLIADGLPNIFAWAVGLLGDGFGSLFFLRLVLALAVLFPPTFLMGMTLPLLSGYVTRRGQETGRGVGVLYGVNTLGAMVGCVTSGFLLLDLFGEWRTGLIAAAMNVLAAVIVAAGLPRSPASDAAEALEAPPPAPHARRLLWLYGISGFCALGYQLIWSRLLIVVLGNSVYGFSSMLTAFLLGIACGSAALSSRFGSRLQRPLLAFAGLEAAIALLGMVSLVTFVQVGAAETRSEYLYATLWTAADLPGIPLRALLVVFPSTFAMGALFPLVTRLCVAAPEGTAPAVAKVYGWNTVGSILGSAATGFLLIPWLGTQVTFFLLALTSLALAAAGLVLSHREERTLRLGPVLAIGLAAFLGIASFLREDPFLTVFTARLKPGEEILHHAEDKAATVTVVHSRRNGFNSLYVNGLELSSNLYGSRLLIHFPSLLHPEPESTLIVGLGAGQAFRASLDQGCETTVVELVGTVVECFPLFERSETTTQDYMRNPKGRVVVDDARNHLLRSPEQVDILMVDGSPPIYASGTVNLYSLEFVQLVHSRLTDDGIFALWLPSLFEDDLWMITRNMTEVFPHVQLLAPEGWYGCFLLGSKDSASPFEDMSKETLRARARARAWPNFPEAWGEVLAESVVISPAELRRRASGYPLVTDDRPRTEYPLFPLLRGKKMVMVPRQLFAGE